MCIAHFLWVKYQTFKFSLSLHPLSSQVDIISHTRNKEKPFAKLRLKRLCDYMLMILKVVVSWKLIWKSFLKSCFLYNVPRSRYGPLLSEEIAWNVIFYAYFNFYGNWEVYFSLLQSIFLFSGQSPITYT